MLTSNLLSSCLSLLRAKITVVCYHTQPIYKYLFLRVRGSMVKSSYQHLRSCRFEPQHRIVFCLCVGGVGSSKLSMIQIHYVEARRSVSSRTALATRGPVSKSMQLLYCIIQLESGKAGVKTAFKSLQENSSSILTVIFFIHTCI